ncbi:protein implicated in iron transport, frataxin homolog [Serpentinimonas raichei]|jgi:CyaY protein|uniref:Iron-sulfur cluster assembly protein CyaY n=1 Tax=Serpentinimonas raichei TaxID=1458425 RepID=A0A060NFD1_9BURK|nr:iron donor protein CyaY [Serpentinimonas raichei]BAO80121.1 protein implicated in iron transport, frataxin homolog [Serpentinimonas raichei]
MNDTEYLNRAEALLQAVERCCDRINDESEVDIDNQRVGSMVTLVFRDGSQIVINLQKPLHEVWMAARSGGTHYRFDGQHWLDTKGAGEFFERLSQEASAQARAGLRFSSGA